MVTKVLDRWDHCFMKIQRRPIKGSSQCPALASAVWAVWTNPSKWPGGIIDAANIDGEFVAGAKIMVKVKGGLATTSTIVRVDPPRVWICVSKFPGLTMLYEHVIEGADGGTVLTERIIMSGLFAGIVTRLIGNRLEETIAATTARIALLAEARPLS
jgi:hypothetical protein